MPTAVSTTAVSASFASLAPEDVQNLVEVFRILNACYEKRLR
jgi:hypothetical protein